MAFDLHHRPHHALDRSDLTPEWAQQMRADLEAKLAEARIEAGHGEAGPSLVSLAKLSCLLGQVEAMVTAIELGDGRDAPQVRK